MSTLKIGDRVLGAGQPVFIVAELSTNHSGQLDIALEAVRAVKESGANAIKLQTDTPETSTINNDQPDFLISDGMLWSGRTLYELYREAQQCCFFE